MKTYSKVLSMFLVVVMCFGLFAASAFADFDFDNGGSGSFTAGESFTAGDGFDFGGNSGFSSTATYDSYEQTAPAAQNGEFTLNTEEPAAAEFVAEEVVVAEAAEKEGVVNNAGDNFQFGSMTQADTFNVPYDDTVHTDMAITTATITLKNEAIEITGLEFDTFKSFKVAAGTNFENSVTVPNEYVEREGTSNHGDTGNKITILATWVKMQSPGYYTIWGIKESDGTPVRIGTFQINKGTYTFTIDPNTYTKPVAYGTKGSGGVAASGSTTDMGALERFGVASSTGSYTHVLGINDYSRTTTKITLEETYLKSLEDGEYWLIGFPSDSSTSNQIKMGKFYIKSGKTGGTYTLTPDYQMWYGGTDPLTFYSQIHDIAGKDWNYKGYEWDVTVPDIIVSTRSSMSGATSVRIDQYWDLGYGYIMLGTNFLNSLSPEETYYMQVIDARAPDLVRSNVVSFRVGPTLRAIDTDKHVINSTRSLRFRSSSPVSEVYVGNIQLTDAADYGVSWDGKTVTLSFEFLNKRTPGNTYTIKVRTTDGNYASTTFQVLTTAQGSASPRTGDESNLGLWAAFLLLSGTAVVVLVPKLRKNNF